jgi:hypothetical protein
MQAVGDPGPISHMDFRELSSVMLLLGKQSLLACAFCYCGTVGSQGPACTGTPISLEFQDEGNRSCGEGECGALSSYVCWAAGLTTKGVPSDGAWSHMLTLGEGGIGSVEL